MGWFGGKDEKAASQTEPGADEAPPPTFSMSELMMPPPESSSSRDVIPSYLDEAEPEDDPFNSLNNSGSYIDVDVRQLERKREEREERDSFVNRAKRGDLTMKDVPGAGMASSGLLTLGNTIAAPFRMVMEGIGTIVWVGVLMVCLAVMAWALTEMLQSQFGYMF
jgi:hypothetical protein